MLGWSCIVLENPNANNSHDEKLMECEDECMEFLWIQIA
jgi:hypothetical protein